MNPNKLILNDSQKCMIKSFGEKNPDKYFLVIRQEGGSRGLFSILSSVICWLDFSDRHGFIPIVDFENFKNVYNENEEIFGTKNSFNYYFSISNNYSLEEVYSSKNVIFTSNGFPNGYSYSITNNPASFEMWVKHVIVKDFILKDVDLFQNINFQSKTLGVHFRGQEMRTARAHWLPPTKKQMLYAIERMLKYDNYNKIFVVSEDINLLKSIIYTYGSSVVSCNHYRTSGSNAYYQYPRVNHKYLLGLEVCIDTILLSRCQGLIHCTSNVAEFAKFLNNGKYESITKINNGPNSKIWPISKGLWYLKKLLPHFSGGFSIKESVLLYSKN